MAKAKARVLSTKKKSAAKKPVQKHVAYEPSHFIWLSAFEDEPRQPALVLYGEENGVLIVYVTPIEKGDDGRREVPYSQIEGRIH